MPDKLAIVRSYAIKAANREPVVKKTDIPPDMADKVNLLLTLQDYYLRVLSDDPKVKSWVRRHGWSSLISQLEISLEEEIGLASSYAMIDDDLKDWISERKRTGKPCLPERYLIEIFSEFGIEIDKDSILTKKEFVEALESGEATKTPTVLGSTPELAKEENLRPVEKNTFTPEDKIIGSISKLGRPPQRQLSVSARQAAALLKITSKTITRWEKGRNKGKYTKWYNKTLRHNPIQLVRVAIKNKAVINVEVAKTLLGASTDDEFQSIIFAEDFTEMTPSVPESPL